MFCLPNIILYMEMIKSGREWSRRKTNSNVIKIRFTYNLWYEYLIRPHAMYNVYHPLKIWLFSQGAVPPLSR